MTLQEANDALVFAYDYRPLVPFEVVSRLQQDAVDDILGREIDDEPVVDDPQDYSGYVVVYMPDGDAGEYTIVFVEDSSLDDETEYEFATDAVYFDTDVNLLEVQLEGVDRDEETPTPEEETPEEETPTPEEDTPTPEEGTPTPEAGTPTPEAGTPTPTGGGGGGNGGNGGGGGDGGGA